MTVITKSRPLKEADISQVRLEALVCFLREGKHRKAGWTAVDDLWPHLEHGLTHSTRAPGNCSCNELLTQQYSLSNWCMYSGCFVQGSHVSTVEPLIKDPLRKGHCTLFGVPKVTVPYIHWEPRTTSLQGTKLLNLPCPQSVLCLEVRLENDGYWTIMVQYTWHCTRYFTNFKLGSFLGETPS